jgi:hypothetical protein
MLENSIKKNRDKKSIKEIICFFSKWYAIIASILFFIWGAFVWASYISDGNLREYCIHVSVDSGGPYHFRISEHNACLIDWWYFVKEPFFMTVLAYTVLIGPALILWFFLRKKKSVSNKENTGN